MTIPLLPIATYTRVSTSNQEEDGTIKTQIATLKEFAEKNGYSIVQEYSDDGWSGDNLARPGLDSLRQDATKNLWSAVLIYDPDRLARRYSYQELIMDELRESGVDLLFVTVGTPKNSEDKILYGVRGLFAEYERVKITERFRLGKLRKIKEGHIMVAHPLYGYNYIPKQPRQEGKEYEEGCYYTVNETEARVVRMIFDWVDKESLSINAVIQRLHRLNIPPRKSKTGHWSASTISRLLRNKAYIGEAHWGKTMAVVPKKTRNTDIYRKKKKSSTRIRPESEWLTIPVPSIIDKEQFYRVRTGIANNVAYSQRNRKHDYLLSGKIWCPCGMRRHGCIGGGTKYPKQYYRCSRGSRTFPIPSNCKEKSLKVLHVDEAVWNLITALLSSPKLLAEQLANWLKEKSKPVKKPEQEIGLVQNEIQKLKKQEDRYYKAYGEGLIPMEKLKEYTVPIVERIQALKTQVETEQQDEKTSAPIPTLKDINTFINRCPENIATLSFKIKREIIVEAIQKVIASHDRLYVVGHLPMDMLLDSNLTNDGNATAQENTPRIPFQFIINLNTRKIENWTSQAVGNRSKNLI